MNDRLKTFRQELLDELEHDILPFWIERVMAPAESRFYGRIGGDGRLYPDADQSAVLYGRLVWTFSAAYRMAGRRELLAAATCARNYLLDHFIDPEYGGFHLLMLMVGRSDTVCGDVTYALHEQMTEAGIEHIFYDVEGGHQNIVWQNALYNFCLQLKKYW